MPPLYSEEPYHIKPVDLHLRATKPGDERHVIIPAATKGCWVNLLQVWEHVFCVLALWLGDDDQLVSSGMALQYTVVASAWCCSQLSLFFRPSSCCGAADEEGILVLFNCFFYIGCQWEMGRACFMGMDTLILVCFKIVRFIVLSDPFWVCFPFVILANYNWTSGWNRPGYFSTWILPRGLIVLNLL